MSTFRLEQLFAPRSVAVVGGSPRPSSLGAVVLRNLASGGFAGEIAVVNPNHASIGGRATFPNLASLPFVPDLVVVTAPASVIPDIIAQAARRGVAGAVILSAGLGHGPGSMAEAIAQEARACGLRIVGPNCLGIMFPASRLNA